jgi:hypothetical protein
MNKLSQTAKKLFQTVKSQPLKFFFLAVWVGGLLLLYRISEDVHTIAQDVKYMRRHFHEIGNP